VGDVVSEHSIYSRPFPQVCMQKQSGDRVLRTVDPASVTGPHWSGPPPHRDLQSPSTLYEV